MLTKFWPIFAVLAACLIFSPILISAAKIQMPIISSGAVENRIVFNREFKILELDTDAEVQITTGSEDSITYSGSGEFVRNLEIKDTSQKLTVLEDRSNPRLGLVSRGPAKRIDITLKNIQEIKISGGAKTNFTALQLENLTIYNYTSKLFKIDRLENTNLKVSNFGLGTLEIIGKTENLELTISGESILNLDKLTAKTANVNLQGKGLVQLNITETLNGEINSQREILYYGSPVLDVKLQNLENVKPRA